MVFEFNKIGIITKLRWAIEEFGNLENVTATFATKFDAVDDLLIYRKIFA